MKWKEIEGQASNRNCRNKLKEARTGNKKGYEMPTKKEKKETDGNTNRAKEIKRKRQRHKQRTKELYYSWKRERERDKQEQRANQLDYL